MNKKRFGLYKGLIMIAIFGVLLLCFFLIFLINYIPYVSNTLFWNLLIIFLIIFSLPSISTASYRLIVVGDKIEEKGWLSPKRVISIQSINSIEKFNYNFKNYITDYLELDDSKQKILNQIFFAIFVATRFRYNPYASMPMISFRGDIPMKLFPLHPINPKIVEVLLEINPKISVDSALVDILPAGLRNKLGIKLTIIDQVGLWLWRILWIIATPLLLLFAIIALISMWNYLVPLYKLY